MSYPKVELDGADCAGGYVRVAYEQTIRAQAREPKQ